jgi:UDP-N-acetylmuramyl pentapeptide synthase
VRAAIDVLAAAPSPRRWLVLGDMGEAERAVHAFIAKSASRARSAHDQLLTVGALTAESVAAFGAGAQHSRRWTRSPRI